MGLTFFDLRLGKDLGKGPSLGWVLGIRVVDHDRDPCCACRHVPPRFYPNTRMRGDADFLNASQLHWSVPR